MGGVKGLTKPYDSGRRGEEALLVEKKPCGCEKKGSIMCAEGKKGGIGVAEKKIINILKGEGKKGAERC